MFLKISFNSKLAIGTILALALLIEGAITVIAYAGVRETLGVVSRYDLKTLLAIFVAVKAISFSIRHREHVFKNGFDFNYCKNHIEKLDLSVTVPAIIVSSLIIGIITGCLDRLIP